MAMSAIFQPVLAMLALTMVVWFVMSITRIKQFSNEKDPSALDTRDKVQARLEGPARQSADNFNNLLEVPVLFYVLCIIVAVTGMVTTLQVVCAWIFVLARVAHSIIQCSYNNVPHRFGAYAVSCISLLVMLIAAIF